MKFTLTATPDESLPLFTESPTTKDAPKAIAEEFKKATSPKIVRTLGLAPQPSIVGGGFASIKTPLALRRAYSSMSKSLASLERIHWKPKKMSDTQLRAALIGLHQGSYVFDHYKTKKATRLTEVHISGLPRGQRKVFNEAEVLAEAVAFCRDLVNTPAEDMGPDQFVKAAQKEARGAGLKLKVLSEADCQKKNMGALLAVGRSSHRKPRMLIVEWPGTSKAAKKPFLALCGKGVCFDTGGLGLKPSSGMLLMRKDMGGAATVLAAMIAMAKLKERRRIRCYIPLVENAIGPDAFRPGDVLTAMDGTTIEVGHTDAEGRLILADAIALARKEGAQQILSVATLTGAAMIALGRVHIPIMGDKKILSGLQKAAKDTGEKVWELPMDDEHRGMVKGKFADLTNSDGSGQAGCITAGAFLSHFAKDTPFAHADISPVSWEPATGATGAFVTTLVGGV